MRTPLPYYGAKVQMAKRLAKMAGFHEVYLEPFCGSAAFFFEKPQARECEQLSDANGWVVDALSAVRDCPHELIDRLPNCTMEDIDRANAQEGQREKVEALPHGFRREDWLGAIGRIKANDFPDDVSEAALIQITGWWTSFNSSPWSGSQSARMTIQYARAVDGGELERRILNASARLQGVGIDRMDALEALGWAERDTLVFCDPPYMRYKDRSKGSRGAAYSGYGGFDPDWEWHGQFLDAVECAVRRGVRFILTTGRDELYQERLPSMGMSLLQTYGTHGGARARVGLGLRSMTFGTPPPKHLIWSNT